MTRKGKRRRYLIGLALVITWVSFLGLNPWKAASSVSADLEPAKHLVDVLVTKKTENTRVVIIGDGNLYNHTAFKLNDPSRIVIDILNVVRLFPKRRLNLNTSEIARMRTGEYPNKVRLVFDVTKKALQSYSLKKEGNKLVLLVGEVGHDTVTGEGIQSKKRPILKMASPAVVKKDQDIKENVAESTSLSIKKLKPAENPSDLRKGEEKENPLKSIVEKKPIKVDKPMKIASTESDSSPEKNVELKKEVQPNKLEDSSYTKESTSFTVSKKLDIGMVETKIEQFRSRVHTGTEPGRVYTGRKISLDFHNIDIRNVFRILKEVSGLNYIIDPKIKGKITMSLKELPWDQALDLILVTNKLGMIREGNVIRVGPLSDLRKEEEAVKRMREAALKARLAAQKAKEEAALEAQKRAKELMPLERKILQVNYAKAKEMEKKFKKFLGARGQIFSDDRTNTVTVIDIPDNINTIEELIKRIDLPTPQVLIEARIVAASSTFSRGLGVQWGLGYETMISQTGRTNKDWVFRTGDFTVDYTPGTPPTRAITDAPFGINFPVVGPASVGFTFAKLMGDIFQIDLRITAAEDKGEVKTLSRPKIITFDNVEAFITQGTEIPFQQQTAEGVPTIIFKKAAIELKVTPHITPDGKVQMKVDVKEDEIGTPVPVGVLGTAPTISIRQAKTELMINSGGTIVIGGVFRQRQTKTVAGVPGLMDIPLLSWLFKNRIKTFNNDELLIFITPFILREERKA